jgi:hypothetical protein
MVELHPYLGYSRFLTRLHPDQTILFNGKRFSGKGCTELVIVSPEGKIVFKAVMDDLINFSVVSAQAIEQRERNLKERERYDSMQPEQMSFTIGGMS